MSKTVVSSDIFELTDFVKELKKEYIPLSNEDTLYTSTFGYIGELGANILQNSIIAASEYSNEAIPTRAKFDRNVIIHAMTLGIDKVHAQPSRMPIALAIPESCVVQNMSNKKGGTPQENTFTIDRTIPFMIEGVEFHLDYDINITRYKKTYVPNNPGEVSDVIYTARYDMTNINPISTIDNEILPTIGVFRYADIFQNSLSKSDNVLVVYTSLSQVIYNENEVIISSDNDLLNKTLSFQFDDQLAYFDVAVYEANSDTPRVLTPIYDGLYKDGVTDYCYYSYVNTNNIRIRFDRDVCQPKMNSKVVIRIYTTLGTGGNFKYSEQITVRFPSTVYVDYNNAYAMIQQRDSGASGGLNRATTKELQEIIPKEMLSRGFVTTTTDLQNYFNSLSTENSIVYVYRKEDSLLRKTYYSYSLMKDDDGNILPTNTIPIQVLSVPINDSDDIQNVAFLESGSSIFLPYNGQPDAISSLLVEPDSGVFSILPTVTAGYEGPGLIDAGNIAFPCYVYDTRVNTCRVTIQEDAKYEAYVAAGGEPLNDVTINLALYEVVEAPGFTYTTPYSMIVTQPTATTGSIRPRCSFIVDTVNENKFTSFEFINDKSTIQFIASNVVVTRPSYLSYDRYVYYMDIDLMPNQIATGLDGEQIQTTAVFYEDGVPKGYVTGYHVPSLDESTSFHFRFRFETTPLADAWLDNKLKIKEVYSIGATSKSVDPIKYFKEHIDVDIFTMYHYTAGNLPCKTIAQSIGSGDDVYGEIARYQPISFPYPFQVRDTEILGNDTTRVKYYLYKNEYDPTTDPGNPHPIYEEPSMQKYLARVADTPDINYNLGDMVLTNKYRISSGINIFYNYSNYMSSHVSISQASDRIRYTLNRVPVVRYDYMNDETRAQFMMDELRKAMLYVSSSIGKLETLFGIDFKLFNTYGPSKIYNIQDSTGNISPLNQVNLTLSFRVQLYTDADKNIVEQIKTDIKTYIEDIRTIKNIHMPNLVSQITKTYGDYLVYFEFVGFTNELHKYTALHQHIITDSDAENLKEVPEFLNINFNSTSSLPDINIDIIV